MQTPLKPKPFNPPSSSLFSQCLEGDVKLKTYLTIWFYSEGSSPLEVVEKLRSMGFEPLRGYHDHVYDWGRKVELMEVLQLANKVHETLKGMKVLYKLETE